MEYDDDADRRELLLHSAYDAETVRAMERPLLDKGVPLMRMAAQAVAHTAAGLLDDEDLALEDTSIVLLAGAGDNGGDGLFAAAALAQEGAAVTAVAVGRSLHEAGFAEFVRAGGKVLVLDPAAEIPGCASGFSAGEAGERLQAAVSLASKSHLIIDAMTGIGIHGALRGIPAALAAALGLDGEVPDTPAMPGREPSGDFPLVVAVDTPSGVGVDDGSLPGPYLPADVTVTFGAMKPCAVLPPATFGCGRIELVDFGFDIDDVEPAVEVVDNAFASDAVRLPHVEDGKYSRGVVGLVTGSQRYPGAAVLTARAAARANTGMVRYLGPERAQNMVLTALPEAVMGKGHVQSWVVGSGVPNADAEGADADIQRETIGALLRHYALDGDPAVDDAAYDMPPVVVDAGALDLLPERVPGQVVITPHAGEMASLLNRLESASQSGERGADDTGSVGFVHDGPSQSDTDAADRTDDDQPYRASAVDLDETEPAVTSDGDEGDGEVAPTGDGVSVPSAANEGSPAYTAHDVMTRPLTCARRAHELTGATVLLKGAVTIVVDEDHTYVSGSAPAWLATAGAGDVLAGLIGALLAQQGDEITTAETVTSAAYLHGMAASIAAESEQQGWQEPELVGHSRRQRFMTLGHPIVAGDVIRAIPEAIADVVA
ncbi:bifunctional ADP-dependent NAD(P)H-hydrate dehydratase/NAD(P)H-hydrate epimerase [Bifidobacterium sp. SO4]|uniref:bifunctional ADP-dependent NAD(P)H-hydrate dehydratase/NAD(P)H-hydrate epimerase n=1 Tax=Bifidobacterium sp. SO4 TaxID=2809030 RepID=UPI001F0A6A63|nr:bifunctional ADP-dependent NAD(P)H-hydrate dehydratase/NAD(P)H-hydrate epimerase [Bifidobacterium sp. SO4]